MKKRLVALLFSFFSLSFANPGELEKKHEGIFADDPWDFLETQFIKNPQAEASKIDKVCLKLLLTTIPTFYAYVLSLLASGSYINAFSRETFNMAQVPLDVVERAEFRVCTALSSVVCLLPTYFVFKLTYNKAHNYILRKIEENNLIKFIENWQAHKLITPNQFHHDFENLHAALHQQSSTLDVKKVNTLLKKTITRHFNTNNSEKTF